jgi:alpha-ketoglutarate-dependent 2,4-dichlorophenoxyacetate dioxygenase
MIQVKKLHPLFVGEVSGVDLSKPVDDETLDAIVKASDEHGILVFRDQQLDDAQQMAFSERLGSLAQTALVLRKDHKARLNPHLTDISNLDENHEILASDDRRYFYALANRFWHTDNAFREIAAKYSLLYAHEVPPEGGETEFADMRAAYDALPEKMKTFLDGKIAIHSLIYSRNIIGFTDYSKEELEGTPSVRHVMVRTHPGSLRKALYLAVYAHEIEGMPTPEARMLIHDLIEHATQRQFVYSHKWRVGDLVMWDNRCTMHRARPYDHAYRRDLRRTTVRETAPSMDLPENRAAVA